MDHGYIEQEVYAEDLEGQKAVRRREKDFGIGEHGELQFGFARLEVVHYCR